MSERQIKVDTQPVFMPDQSRPAERKFFFAYTITITNMHSQPCQLLHRHWIITNAEGEVQEVKGEGVIGKQPMLLPSESFTYTSGAMLETPVGTMHGSYQFVEGDEVFDVPIEAFLLSVPGAVN